MPISIPITGPAFDVGVPIQNQQKLINWYLEVDGAGGKSPMIMRPTPGMTTFCTISGRNSIRGLIDYRGVLYAISDHYLYSVNSSGTATLKGSLNITAAHTTAPIRWCAYNNQIMIIDSTLAYVYDLTAATLTQITDTDFPSSVSDCTNQDGYFLVTETDTLKFYASTFGDAMSWDALDYENVGATGEYVLGLISDHKQVWVFTKKSVEVFSIIETVDFPFSRVDGTLMSMGTASIRTLVQADNSLFWLARDNSGQQLVVRANGYTPQSIMNVAIAAKFNSYSTLDDAFAFCHRIGNHSFYVITLPTEGVTWVYDISTGVWHERQSYIGTSYTRHRANCHAYSYNKSLVGDYQSAVIYYYSTTAYDEGGATLLRKRVTSPLPFKNYETSIYNLKIDVEPGVGLSTGQGSDPQIMLRVSVDGGHTYGNTLSRSLGAQGVYTLQPTWDCLGYGRDWAFEITVTDPVNATILGATADLDDAVMQYISASNKRQ